ncbi:MAG: DUF3524 domain-containing protein [Planctomycetota bacterium]
MDDPSARKLHASDTRSYRVAAIEPYGGGSHLSFLDNWRRRSRHHIVLETLPARHWKWRMRSAPIAMVDAFAASWDQDAPPDLLFVSDMLDLPTWMGFACRHAALRHWAATVPVVTYFHENQWAYPRAPHAREDHHFGYTNLLTASLSDACWFNSDFNRETFLEHSERFLRRMPDSQAEHDLKAVRRKCKTIAPGFVPPPRRADSDAALTLPMVIGWVGRFDHDKRPDRFSELLGLLQEAGVEFELVLLGQRGRDASAVDRLIDRFESHVRWNGFAATRDVYERKLSQMDVVVSTADHEFFGIAICEAIWAGAIPVTPNRLCYPAYVPETLRFDSIEHAARLLAKLSKELQIPGSVSALSEECCQQIEPLLIQRTVDRLDHEVAELIERPDPR